MDDPFPIKTRFKDKEKAEPVGAAARPSTTMSPTSSHTREYYYTPGEYTPGPQVSTYGTLLGLQLDVPSSFDQEEVSLRLNQEDNISSDSNRKDVSSRFNRKDDVSSSFNREDCVQFKPFLKLQSPTVSDFDPDSDLDLGSDSEDGASITNCPTIKEQELDVAEEQVQQTTVDLLDEHSLSSKSVVVHQEVGQPSAYSEENLMVTGCDLSHTLSRFYHKMFVTRRGRRVRSSVRRPSCLDKDLMAQQIITKRGWREHISNPHKRSLKDLDYTHDLIDGHPIGKCILNAFRRDSLYYRGDFFGERKGTQLLNSSQNTTPHRKLFSPKLDESISLWEKAFSKQFGNKHISFKECNITAPLLLVLLYRSAYQGSIMIDHFVGSECEDCTRCNLGVQQTMIKLKNNHSYVCQAAQRISLKQCDEGSAIKEMMAVNEICEQLHLLYHHSEQLAHSKQSAHRYIEFPHFVEVGVHYRKKKLPKILHLVYMQIPPYFFAVPADCCGDTTFRELRPHFLSVIQEIHKELEIERRRFFEQRPDLSDKENIIVMIYPYRFDPGGQHSDCRFLRVNIKVDEG